MAKFVYCHAFGPSFSLIAEADEEIPIDMAKAWALMLLAKAVDEGKDAINEVANAITDAAGN
jgi:hypothetical protein